MSRTFSLSRLLIALMLLALPSAVRSEEPARAAKPSDLIVDVKLNDDSVMKLKLAEDRVEILTKYGKLAIPVADIRKIELGHRVTEEMAKQIERAVSDLGSAQFRTREEAGNLLVSFREKSYPAVMKATQSTDAEVAKRAEEIIEKIRAAVPENKLNIPELDLIVTDDSKFSGKILAQQFKVKSATFGDVSLKLADLVSINMGPTVDERDLASALPDPGSLTNLQKDVGKTFLFKVTGALNGSVWGTETYTLDSTLAAAAVHMGIVKVGQTGYVRVTIFGPLQNFVGSTRNGVTTANYQAYPGAYKIHTKAGN
ncbi:LCCL domain-containing protein [Zavarzinella formosa]|uniref:LCCL domain-containing protein n=1 Tax=Zavarzinella formosa TaxID=360055 RepID=UPI00037E1756|nr:LCCL domain-containing protein [Zavarzinella formosa]